MHGRITAHANCHWTKWKPVYSRNGHRGEGVLSYDISVIFPPVRLGEGAGALFSSSVRTTVLPDVPARVFYLGRRVLRRQARSTAFDRLRLQGRRVVRVSGRPGGVYTAGESHRGGLHRRFHRSIDRRRCRGRPTINGRYALPVGVGSRARRNRNRTKPYGRVASPPPPS